MESPNSNKGLISMWRPTPREQKAYKHLFQLADPENKGIIQGQAAVPFFKNSGLSDYILGNIWQLSDTSGKGHLTESEFSVAMKLISLAQCNKTVALSSLSEDTPLPDLKGVDLAKILGGATGTPSATSLMTPTTETSGHMRRESTTSSVGWLTMMDGPIQRPTVPVVELEQYRRLFDASRPVNGVLDGVAAGQIFAKSKLDQNQIESIWMLADPSSEGKLRLPGFTVAMYYIRRLMENRGMHLPDVCPSSLWQSAGGEAIHRAGSAVGNHSASSSAVELGRSLQWDVTHDEKIRYDQFFNSLDPQRTGTLSGDVPVNFFLKSRLPETELSKVWDLADINCTGKLDKDKFAVAMHIINARISGRKIPDTLPQSLVPPSYRKPAFSSPSMRNLSPQLRAQSFNDRANGDNLKRSATIAPTRNSRSSQSPPTASSLQQTDDSEITRLQGQLSHLEDFSRGLQVQRTTVSNKVAMANTRKQELQNQVNALQSSQEVESKINRELEEKYKAIENELAALQGQIDEEQKRLSVVSAQRAQIEQEVQHAQAQMQEAQHKLRQMQEDSQKMNSEIASLEKQKKHLEQVILVTQSQITQQEASNQIQREQVDSIKQEVGDLDKRLESLPLPSKPSNPTPEDSQNTRSVCEPSEPSFDDIFGTSSGPNPVASDNHVPDLFSTMFSTPSPVHQHQQHQQQLSISSNNPSSVDDISRPTTASASLATMIMAPISSSANVSEINPIASAASAASVASIKSGEPVSNRDAFDAFGTQRADPFEEFLQETAATAATVTTAAVEVPQAGSAELSIPERPSDTFSPEPIVKDKMTDKSPKVTLVPNTENDFDAIFSGNTNNNTESKCVAAAPSTSAAPASPSRSKPSNTSIPAFDTDFAGVFGNTNTTSTKAISQDLETFDSRFPDIKDLETPSIAATIMTTSGSATAAVAPTTTSITVNDASKANGVTDSKKVGDEVLTFDSMFGLNDNNNAIDSVAVRSVKSTTSAINDTSSTSTGSPKQSKSVPLPPASERAKKTSKSDQDFVPPPVIKRTNVAARPISRVLSIFRHNSKNNGGSNATPPVPKQSSDRRSRDSNNTASGRSKFEAQWAHGDWPEWVKRGEHQYERRTLVEMGYDKTRVVEALEVNDFNLAQATEYLISS